MFLNTTDTNDCCLKNVVVAMVVVVVMVCEKQFVELANAFGDITDPPAAQLWESFQKAEPAKALFSGNQLVHLHFLHNVLFCLYFFILPIFLLCLSLLQQLLGLASQDFLFMCFRSMRM